jgi:PadR family transcriptional regulator PadR
MPANWAKTYPLYNQLIYGSRQNERRSFAWDAGHAGSENIAARSSAWVAIAQLIQQLSYDLLRVEEGSLYPALQRLELNGWIEGEWGVSANNRRARFYKLTPEGRKHLTVESARYRKVTGAVARIMGFA